VRAQGFFSFSADPSVASCLFSLPLVFSCPSLFALVNSGDLAARLMPPPCPLFMTDVAHLSPGSAFPCCHGGRKAGSGKDSQRTTPPYLFIPDHSHLPTRHLLSRVRVVVVVLRTKCNTSECETVHPLPGIPV
jgi:hypothetical protein